MAITITPGLRCLHQSHHAQASRTTDFEKLPQRREPLSEKVSYSTPDGMATFRLCPKVTDSVLAEWGGEQPGQWNKEQIVCNVMGKRHELSLEGINENSESISQAGRENCFS